jgi:hypothetical protein
LTARLNDFIQLNLAKAQAANFHHLSFCVPMEITVSIQYPFTSTGASYFASLEYPFTAVLSSQQCAGAG